MADDRRPATNQSSNDMPSGDDAKLSPFDRFATTTSRWVSKPWFFAVCVLLVVV